MQHESTPQPARHRQALVIQPSSPHYETAIQAIRQDGRLDELRRRFNPSVADATAWIDRVPASMREGLLALIGDVDGAWHLDVCNALSDVYFTHLCECLGVLQEPLERYSDEQLHNALSQRVTIATALLRVSSALGLPVTSWLNVRDAEAVMKAAETETDTAA